MAFVEGAVWKQKKTMTGFKWKKRWVRADQELLIQWHSDVKPSEKVKPKHIYHVPKCTVREIRTNKPYAFSVTDNTTGDTIIFAATKVTEYDSWLSVLISDESVDVNPGSGLVDDDLRSGANEPLIDLAGKYFDRHNVSKSSFQMEIDVRQFSDLVRLLGLKLEEDAVNAILQQLQNSNGAVTFKEFGAWLKDYESNGMAGAVDSKTSVSSDTSRLSRRLKKAKKMAKMGKNEILQLNHAGSSWLNVPEPTHVAGVLDTVRLDIAKKVGTVAALSNKVPDIGEIVRKWKTPARLSGLSGARDWNDVYQGLLEEAASMTLGNHCVEDIHSVCSLAALHGTFLNTAATGVQSIVDEYSLPHNLKTVKMLNIDSANAFAEAEQDEEVYISKGLVFRLMGARCNDRDKSPTEARLKFVQASDDIMRKIAGNEVRSLFHTQHALCAVNESDDTMSFSELARPSVLLTTLIDYCGFRFEVFAPVELDEERTLVYGYSASEEIFVNANPVLQTIIPVLGDRLNISVTKKSMLTSPVTLDQREPSDMTQTYCDILSKDLQLHICDDNRVYLLNFSGVIPPDLPRPQSNDSHTRKLRPEYVKEYSEGSIAAEAVRFDLDDKEGGISDTDEQEEGSEVEEKRPRPRSVRPTMLLKPLEPVVNWIRAASLQREELIPDVVLKLDTMTAVPIDSYGLTEFLHSHGVNMRYLGELYLRSRTPHVKDLLLCEAISRSCKTIFNHALRKVSRRGRGETQIAEQRKRSKAEHYVEHQGSLLRDKLTVIVDLFNVIFGSGEETDLFWNDILPAILYEKFEISLPIPFEKSLYVHMHQLLNAVEYHTGVVFKNNIPRYLASNSQPRPFAEEDLDDIVPASKFQQTFPGIFYTVSSLAEAFLACNMYADAIKAFKLKLSLHEISRAHCSKPSLQMRLKSTLTSYNLALCYYLSEKFEAASAILRTELEDCSPRSPVTARLVTLLMCVDFKAGRLSDSMRHYESARELYIDCLGPRHPMVCLMFVSLADLYFGGGALNHSHVMVLKAVDFCEHFVGESHVMYAACAFKLGVVLVKLCDFKEADIMFRKSLAVYTDLSSRGAEFSNERSMCLHGIAVVKNALEDVEGAIDYSVQSLALSTAEDKYVTPQAVDCILLLAELHEKKNLMVEAADLYADAWDIVCAYPKDYDTFRMLLVLSARIMSSHINSLPLPARMLLESVAAVNEDIKQREWDVGCSYVTKQLLQKSPIGYIGDIVQELLEKSNPVLSSSTFGNQTSVVGVPCAVKKIDAENVSERSEDLAKTVNESNVPIELQISIILKIILELT